MRSEILANLATKIDPVVAEAVVDTYVRLVATFRKGNAEATLGLAGKFVEHVLRAIEFLRTGSAPAEIKSPATTVRELEKATSLDESLRLLIPRIAYAMIYDVRSKRGAVHVKEIDPRQIDASLAVHAAGWVIAELLRLFHSQSEEKVTEAMNALLRGYVPFVESFGDEVAVTRNVPCRLELLLLLVAAEPNGLDRRALGISSRYTPPQVTRALQQLERERHVHKSTSGVFRITGPGEQFVADELSVIETRLGTRKPK